MILELRITIKRKLLANQFVYIHDNAQVGLHSGALLSPPVVTDAVSFPLNSINIDQIRTVTPSCRFLRLILSHGNRTFSFINCFCVKRITDVRIVATILMLWLPKDLETKRGEIRSQGPGILHLMCEWSYAIISDVDRYVTRYHFEHTCDIHTPAIISNMFK
jgi:hypothetical protein